VLIKNQVKGLLIMAGLVPFNRNRMSVRSSGFEDFYNMLDDFFNDTWSAPRRSLLSDTFKVDVQENENEYCIDAELPGVKKEDLRLEMNEGRLTISVERGESQSEEHKNYIHRERRYSSMQRSIYLREASPDGISAKLENGVLNILVPKQPKKDNSVRINID